MFVRANTLVAQRYQFPGVTFASDDCFDNAHPAGTLDLADHIVQLQIHQLECLLHVLHVRCCYADMVVTQPYVGAQLPYGLLRNKAAPQKSGTMQMVEPLTVLYVALTPANGTSMSPVDQVGIDSERFEDLHQWKPENTRGFHDGDRHAVLAEVAGRVDKILGERREVLDRLSFDRDVDCLSTDIDPC